MDWNVMVGPVVVAAVVSGVISTVGIWVSRSTNIQVSKDKINADAEQARKRFEFEKTLAERKFAYERQQAIFKRRFELAEQILADAYRFRDLMKYVRNGFSFGVEGESRKPAGLETDDIKRMRDVYFVPVERLHKESEFTSSMMARRYACIAHFGNEVGSAFDAFVQSIQAVGVASSTLIELAGHVHPDNRVLVEKLKSDLWEPMAQHAQNNEIGTKIDGGVKTIERLCKPVLEELMDRNAHNLIVGT
jgi:hypothetical protein